MTIQEAEAILRALHSGADPDTGELLPDGHLLCSCDVREALGIALRVMSQQATQGHVQVNRSGRLNAGRTWTQEDLAELRTLYEGGVSIEEIARLTHRRPRGVRLQLNLMAGGGARRSERVEIPERLVPAAEADAPPPPAPPRYPNSRHPWTESDDALLTTLYREGRDLETLARQFGRSQRGIWARLRKLGLLIDDDELDSPTRPWSEEDIRQLCELYQLGLPVAHIAARMYRTEEALHARLFYMGLSTKSPQLFPAKKDDPT